MSVPAAVPADLAVNILLVDDEPANLMALEAILKEPGRNLVRASSGGDAQRLLEQTDFAVVLLDLQMPGLDGFETARLIRARERSRHTPIIFITAHDPTAFPITEAYRLGAVDYLVKPLTPDVLRAKVAVFVELARRAEQVHRLERQEFERNLAEEALRRSERHFRQMADSAPVLLWVSGPDGLCTWFNRPWLEFTGRSMQQEVGNGWAEGIHPDDRQRCLDTFRSALRARRRFRLEFRLRRRDGLYRWILGEGVPHEGPEVAFSGYVGSAIDITDQRQAREVAEAAQQRAEQADAAKGAFLAMLAHELRAPLAPVLPSLQVLRRAGGSPAVRQEEVERLERQARHLGRMVEDLVDVARLSRGRLTLRTERLDLARLARTAALDRKALLDQAGLTLEVKAPETPVWVQGDATRLTQALNNLLDNAIQYTPAGGRVEVRVCADEAARQASVSVADTGVGIEALLLPRLFEAFSQAEQGIDRARGGLGLGLNVVRGLVDLHGGKVEAASEGPGRGSVFTIRLRLEPEPEAIVEVPKSPSAIGVPRLRVLVVEDNPDAAESLRLLLELLGHEVRVAQTGPDGVKEAAAWRPDAVISDIGLPGIDGYEVARQIRRLGGMERAVLVALTGYGAEEDRRKSDESGFDRHLVKPAEAADIQRALALRKR
jgi:PAS domain S-box-containing protein